ncbi:MAG: isochorismatase family protein, partial [bacterium]|nr:isochorismatase family protein [bacterium]
MATSRGLLCRGDESLLIIIDIQERLAAAMEEDTRRSVLSSIGVLARAAATLAIPTLITEQYPKGLGPTEPSVVEHLPETATRIEKTSFSCGGADGFTDLLQSSGRRQVVLAGMEA